jgi:predicted metal-dependent phosphoesterase TrpH
VTLVTIDLHAHSWCSDGTSSPADVVAAAAQAGVRCLAITDHESVEGLAMAHAAAEHHGLRLLPGIELSAACENGHLHLLGYFIDPEHRGLRLRLQGLRAARLRRNREIAAALARDGLGLDLDAVSAAAGVSPDLLGRRHLRRALASRCLALPRDEVERRFRLAEAQAAPREKPGAADCIELIHQAGGVAVLAHPVTLHPGSPRGWEETIARLRRQGLAGIETLHPDHTVEQQVAFAATARGFELVATGGSDYHGARRPGRALGMWNGQLGIECVDQLERRRS